MRTSVRHLWIPLAALSALLATAGCGDDTSLTNLQDNDEEIVVDTTPPSTPTGIHVYSSPTNLIIEWTANSEADLAGYTLEKSTDRGSNWADVNVFLTESTYEDVYASRADYRVRASDFAGNESAPSSTATYLVSGGDRGPKIPARPR